MVLWDYIPNSRMQMRTKNIDSDLSCVTTLDYPVLSQVCFILCNTETTNLDDLNATLNFITLWIILLRKMIRFREVLDFLRVVVITLNMSKF